MYSVVRIFEGGGLPASDGPEAARTRAEALDWAAGLVTLLAIKGDDGAFVTVEIFETVDDMKIADAAAGRDARRLTPEDGLAGGRTIAGEIVFQRGL